MRLLLLRPNGVLALVFAKRNFRQPTKQDTHTIYTDVISEEEHQYGPRLDFDMVTHCYWTQDKEDALETGYQKTDGLLAISAVAGWLRGGS